MLTEPEDNGTAARKKQAAEMYRQGEQTSNEIAKELGVSRATLYNWLNAAGVAGKRGRADAAAAATDISDVASEMAELRRAIRESGALDLGDVLREVAGLRQAVTELLQATAILNGSISRVVGIVEVMAGLRKDEVGT
jgi:transposase-like protein